MLALKGAALLAAAAALVTTAQADLTTGLVAYWPFDTTNASSTPDVQNGYDLFSRSGASVVPMGGKISLVPGKHGNALSFNGSASTLLAYISPLNALGNPSTQLPPSQYPSWTLSFWVNGTQAANSGGGQRAACIGCASDSSPLWDFAVGGQNGTTANQIDQFIRMAGGQNGQGTQFIQATGGSHRALNTPWLDGTWHNVTETVNYITNYPAPLLGPITAPASGQLSFTFSSIPLDTTSANETNQVNTNQQYLLQESTDLSQSPNARWVTVATQASAGYNGTTITYNNATNTNAFYRIVAPAIRLQQWEVYFDGVLVGDSLAFNATNANEPLGVPVPNSGATSVNYLPNFGNNPAGSDPAAIQPPLGVWKMDTLAFGGISRNGGTGSYFTGAMDDVAVWSRALSAAEITSFMANGIPNPAHNIPLAINLDVDFPAVAVGDSEGLSWTGAKDGTQFTLTPGNINENGNTVQGVGQDSQPVNATTTFTIAETRGVSTVTSSRTVTAVSGVAPNWHYIDSFTLLPTNLIAGQPSSTSTKAQWDNPPAGYNTGMLPMRVYASSVDSNKYVSFDGQAGTAGALAGRLLNGDSIPVGSSATLFFRFEIDSNANNPDPNLSSQIPDIDCNVGLTDKGFRDVADFDGQLGNNTGPAVYITRFTAGAGGAIDLKCVDGSANMGLTPGGYSYIGDTVSGDPNGLAVGKIYNVWIDVQNNDAGVAGGLQSGGAQTNGAYYTVWLQREDWAARTNLFATITPTSANNTYPTGVLVSDRDDTTADNIEGPTDQKLTGLFLDASRSIAPTATNCVRFDDFYLSKGGFNSSVPVAAGSLTR